MLPGGSRHPQAAIRMSLTCRTAAARVNWSKPLCSRPSRRISGLPAQTRRRGEFPCFRPVKSEVGPERSIYGKRLDTQFQYSVPARLGKGQNHSSHVGKLFWRWTGPESLD